MGVREIDRFLEQWQMDARDLHRQIILSPTPRYVRDALTRAGYAPIVTGNPEEVSRLMREEAPRLVLLDLMLPGTDGIILMKSIRETADVPVIFLSAYGQDQVIARAFDMGAASAGRPYRSMTRLSIPMCWATTRMSPPTLPKR